MDSDGQTDKELYDALKDMGYNFGKYGTSKFDEDGFSETAVNLGYRWDEKKKVWHNKNMMADGGMTKTKPTSDAEMKETMRQLLTRNKNSHSRAKGRIELYSGSFKDRNSFFTEYEKRFGKQDADIVKKAKANYDSAVLVKMADGGQTFNDSEADDFYEDLQVYVQGKGSIYKGKSLKEATEAFDDYYAKHPHAEIVMVDEKYGDELKWANVESDNDDEEYRRGGRTKAEITADKRYKALKAGKRVSEDGNVYYESRANRSDVSRRDKKEDGEIFRGNFINSDEFI